MTLKRLVISVLLVLGVVAIGCTTGGGASKKEANADYDKVFRGRWWSYYDRGSFYLAQKQFDKAAADFQVALKGRSEDTWRARTYGLHFVEYFPARELGVAYFELKQYDEAQAELEKSLKLVDTVRARHYLDLVKETKISEGKVQDTASPALEFDLRPAEILAKRDLAPEAAIKPAAILATGELSLTLTTKDDNGVKEVKINDQKVYQRGSEMEIKEKKQEIRLNEGTQEIKVASKDLAGKETVKTEKITVDLTAPNIGVYTPIEPTVTEEGTVMLEGAAVDKYLVANVNVDKKPLADSPGAPRLDFNSELPLGDGENTFVVASKDVAGNEGRTAVKVFKGDPNSTEAKLWLLEQKYPERMKLAMTGAVALDVLLSQTPPAAVAVNEIRVKSPDASRPYRNDNTLRVSGEVVTQTSISSLSINGQPMESLTGAPKESFNKRIPITPESLQAGGKVKVTIEAQEAGGAKLSKEVEVAVQPVLIDRPETKMPVAVLAFKGTEQLGELAQQIRTKTEGDMVGQKRFRVLERVALQEVLTEQQLSAALSDPDEALKLGKMTPAQIFLIGEVFPRGEKGVEVMARAVNTASGEIEDKVDGFVDDRSDPAALDKLCDSLATELREKYPRRSGEIQAVAEKGGEKLVLLDWTAEDLVRPGMRIWILRPQADPFADPSTQEEVSPSDFTEAAQGVIRQLRSNGAEAVVEKLIEEGTTLEKGMPAITM